MKNIEEIHIKPVSSVWDWEVWTLEKGAPSYNKFGEVIINDKIRVHFTHSPDHTVYITPIGSNEVLVCKRTSMFTLECRTEYRI